MCSYENPLCVKKPPFSLYCPTQFYGTTLGIMRFRDLHGTLQKGIILSSRERIQVLTRCFHIYQLVKAAEAAEPYTPDPTNRLSRPPHSESPGEPPENPQTWTSRQGHDEQYRSSEGLLFPRACQQIEIQAYRLTVSAQANLWSQSGPSFYVSQQVC